MNASERKYLVSKNGIQELSFRDALDVNSFVNVIYHLPNLMVALQSVAALHGL